MILMTALFIHNISQSWHLNVFFVRSLSAKLLWILYNFFSIFFHSRLIWMRFAREVHKVAIYFKSFCKEPDVILLWIASITYSLIFITFFSTNPSFVVTLVYMAMRIWFQWEVNEGICRWRAKIVQRAHKFWAEPRLSNICSISNHLPTPLRRESQGFMWYTSAEPVFSIPGELAGELP